MLNFEMIYNRIAEGDRRTALLMEIYRIQSERRERLNFEDVAERLGVARGTIRRDVGQLAGMKIISLYPDGTLQINKDYIDDEGNDDAELEGAKTE